MLRKHSVVVVLIIVVVGLHTASREFDVNVLTGLCQSSSDQYRECVKSHNYNNHYLHRGDMSLSQYVSGSLASTLAYDLLNCQSEGSRNQHYQAY